MIEEPDWHDDTSELDFHARYVARHQSLPFSPEEQTPRTVRRDSVASASSMAVAVHSHTNSHFDASSSFCAPSLEYSATTRASSSIRTSEASVVRGGLLDENEFGALEVPADTPAPREPWALQCIFDFLMCPYGSDDFGEWMTHCTSHFRGAARPTISTCIECNWDHTGAGAWEAKMDHVARYHQYQPRGSMSKDQTLFRHLWRNRVVDDAQYQVLKTYGRLDGTSDAFVMTQRPRRNGGRPATSRP